MNYLTTHSKKMGVISLLLLMVATYSCSDLTSSYNDDPNSTGNAPTSYLLTDAQQSLSNNYWGEFPLGYFGNQYSQYWAQNQYSDESRYAYRPGVINDIWNSYYLSLNTLQQIIRQNKDNPSGQAQYGKAANQIAVAKIMKAFAYQNLTEIWGDVPFEEALGGAENPSPAYTSQKEVYKGIIKMLTEASKAIDTSSETFASGDIIYGGDMTKWKKLANSLKMRIGIRLLDANPSIAKPAIKQAFNAGVITSNDANALFTYKSQPNNNPIQNAYIDRDDFAISNTLAGYMKSNDDPRISSYAEKTFTNKAGEPLDGGRPSGVDEYIGFPYGEAQGKAASRKQTHKWSRPSLRVRKATAPAILMTASEMLFDVAEAAQEGVILSPGVAGAKYNKAIERSMSYWDIEDKSDISNFKASVPYSGASNKKKLIAKQKWVALYMQGIQGWSVYRRTNFGLLQEPKGGQTAPADFTVNGEKDIAMRYPYPVDENQLNRKNKNEALSSQGFGNDDQGQKLWFDKKSE